MSSTWAKKNPEKWRAYKRQWAAANKEKVREHRRAYRERHPEKVKASSRRHRQKNPEMYIEYEHARAVRAKGLTKEQYAALQRRQGGVCAICGGPPKKRRLSIDHDHVTGEVRGLLCQLCNVGIGNLHDDPALLERAAQYLRATETQVDGARVA